MKCLLSSEQRFALAKLIFGNVGAIAESNQSITLDNFVRDLYNKLIKNGLSEDTALDAARLSIGYFNRYQAGLSSKNPSLFKSFYLKNEDELSKLGRKILAFTDEETGLDAVRSVLGLNVNLAEKANTLQQQINNTKKDEESISQEQEVYERKLKSITANPLRTRTLYASTPDEFKNRSVAVMNKIISQLRNENLEDSSSIGIYFKALAGEIVREQLKNSLTSENAKKFRFDQIIQRNDTYIVLTDNDGNILLFDEDGNVTDDKSQFPVFYPLSTFNAYNSVLKNNELKEIFNENFPVSNEKIASLMQKLKTAMTKLNIDFEKIENELLNSFVILEQVYNKELQKAVVSKGVFSLEQLSEEERKTVIDETIDSSKKVIENFGKIQAALRSSTHKAKRSTKNLYGRDTVELDNPSDGLSGTILNTSGGQVVRIAQNLVPLERIFRGRKGLFNPFIVRSEFTGVPYFEFPGIRKRIQIEEAAYIDNQDIVNTILDLFTAELYDKDASGKIVPMSLFRRKQLISQFVYSGKEEEEASTVTWIQFNPSKAVVSIDDVSYKINDQDWSKNKELREILEKRLNSSLTKSNTEYSESQFKLIERNLNAKGIDVQVIENESEFNSAPQGSFYKYQKDGKTFYKMFYKTSINVIDELLNFPSDFLLPVYKEENGKRVLDTESSKKNYHDFLIERFSTETQINENGDIQEENPVFDLMFSIEAVSKIAKREKEIEKLKIREAESKKEKAQPTPVTEEEAPVTKKEPTTGFQGYKFGFEDKGKGTPQGDGKDKAMREVADGAIVELSSDKDSSSKTSLGAVGSPKEGDKVIMLARNGSLSGKPLRAETKQQIREANLDGAEFVVGDMPGVDSQFIDYLQEIGAKFTIYHTGPEGTSRIKIEKPSEQPTTPTVTEEQQAPVTQAPVTEEQTRKRKGERFDINSPDFVWNKSYLQRLKNEKVTEEHIKAAEEWWSKSPLSKFFPVDTVLKAINSSKNGPLAEWSVNGIILYHYYQEGGKVDKSRSGDFTDIYHEAWHGFTQTFLSKEELNSIYDEFRKREGSFVDYQGNYVLYKDAKPWQAEEFLAEEFRRYAMGGGKVIDKTKSPVRNTIFRRILNFLKELFGKTTVEEFVANPMANSKIFEMYDKLYTGDLSGYTFDPSRVQSNTPLQSPYVEPATDTTEAKIWSYQDSMLMVRTIESLISDTIDDFNRAGNDDSKNVTAQLLTKSLPITRRLYNEVLWRLDNEVLEDLNIKLKNAANQAEALEISHYINLVQNTIDTFGDPNAIDETLEGDGFLYYHMEKSKITDVFLEESEDQDPETVDLIKALNNYERGGNESSLKDIASDQVKRLLKSIKRYDEKGNVVKNVIGRAETENSSVVFFKLAKLLGGTLTKPEMYNKMLVAAEADPIVKEVLSKLGIPDSKTMSSNVLWTQFWKVFNSSNVKLVQMSVREKSDGHPFDKSYKYEVRIGSGHSSEKPILNKWHNTFGIQEFKNYKKIDPAKNKAYVNINSLVEFLKDKKLDPKKVREFLAAVGVDLSYKQNINDFLSKPETYEKVDAVFQNIIKMADMKVERLYTLGEVFGEATAASPFFGKKEIIGMGSFLNELAVIESTYGNYTGTFSQKNAEGNVQYEFTLNNTISIIVNTVNSVNSYKELMEHPEMQHLNIKNSPFVNSSLLFERLFDMEDYRKGGEGRRLNKIEFNNLSGVKLIGEKSDVGVAAAKSDEISKLITDLHLTLEGRQELMRHADKGTSFTLYIKGKGLYVDLKKLSSPTNPFEYTSELVYSRYFKAEFERIKKLDELYKKSRTTSIEYDQTYLDKGRDFHIFESILDDNLKTEVLKYNSFDEIPKSLVSNKIIPAINQYFERQVQDVSNRLGTETFIDDKLYAAANKANDNLVQDNKTVILRTFVVNNWIHNVETLSLIYGDLALYNHLKEEFHKRNAGAGSTGTLFASDKASIKYALSKGMIYANNLRSKDPNYVNEYIPVNDDGSYNSAVFEDNKIASIYYDELVEGYKEELYERFKDKIDSLSEEEADKFKKELDKKAEKTYKEYSGMTEGDAQGWITFDAYRAFSILEGNWSNDQDNLYRKIAQGEKINQEKIAEFFPTRKFQYWGPLKTEEGVPPLMGFHKFSLVPLIPTMIEGKNLEKLHDKMIKENIAYSLFKSGSKVSTIVKIDNGKAISDKFYSNSEEHTFDDSKEYTKNTAYLHFLKNQLEIASSFKEKVTFPTQMRKLVFNGLMIAGIPTDFEKSLPLSERIKKWDSITSEEKKREASKFYNVLKEYENNIQALSNLLKEELKKKATIKHEDPKNPNSPIILTPELKKFILSELDKQDLGDHELDFMKTAPTGKVIRDLSFSLSTDKLDRVLNTIVTKRLVKQKFTGEGLIQVSGAGFESYNRGIESEVLKDLVKQRDFKNIELLTLLQEQELNEQRLEVVVALRLPKIKPDNARKETGLGVGTKRDINPSLLSTTGVTVENAAELLMEDMNELGFQTDEQELRDIIIDVLSTGKQEYLNQYIKSDEIEILEEEIKDLNSKIKDLDSGEEIDATRIYLSEKDYKAAVKEADNRPLTERIPQNLISGETKFGTTQFARPEIIKALGTKKPKSIDMIEGGYRTRTTRTEEELTKYNITEGSYTYMYGSDANKNIKKVLVQITKITKGTEKETWYKEGWTDEGFKNLERFKNPYVIEFKLVQEGTSKRTFRGKLSKEESFKYGTNGLSFYQRDFTVDENGKKVYGKTKAMKVKIALQGPFRALLHLKHNDGNKIENLDRLNDMIKNEEWLNKDNHRNMITITGPRIPVQGLNSMEFAEVYEFLDESAGNIVVLPSEIVAKSGSDFDIDKLTFMYPNLETYPDKAYWLTEAGQEKAKEIESILKSKGFDVSITKDVISKLVTEKRKDLSTEEKKIYDLLVKQGPMNVRYDLSTKTEEGLQNRIQENMREMLSFPENFYALVRPNDKDIVEPIAKDAAKFAQKRNYRTVTDKTTGDKRISATNILEIGYNLDKHQQNRIGKDTLGLGAVDNTYNALFNRIGMRLNHGYSDTFGKNTEYIPLDMYLPHNKLQDEKGRDVISLSHIYDAENEHSISDIISQMINGWVDVAKDAWIFNIQGNKEIAPTLLFMVQAGVPVRQAVMLVSHPLVREYVELQRKYRSTFARPLGMEIDNPNFAQFKTRADMIRDLFPNYVSSFEVYKDSYTNGSIYYLSQDYLHDNEESRKLFSQEKNKEGKTAFESFIVESQNRKGDYSDQDKALFLHFLEIENMAGAVKNAKLKSNFDTKTSNTTFEVNKALSEYEAMLMSAMLPTKIVKKLGDETILKSFKVQDFQKEIFGGLFSFKNSSLLSSVDEDYHNEIRSLFKNDEEVERTYVNDFISYAFQNSIREFNLNNVIDKGYKGSKVVDDSEKVKQVFGVDSLANGVFVKEQNGEPVIYVDRKQLDKQFFDLKNSGGKYQRNLTLPDGTVIKLANLDVSAFGTKDDYLAFVFEREMLRYRYRKEANGLERLKSREDYKNKYAKVKTLFPQKESESNESYNNRIDILTYDVVLRDMALDNVYNSWKMFESEDTYADQFQNILNKYGNKLKNNYSLFEYISVNNLENNGIREMSNLFLNNTMLESDEINRLNQNILELSNPSAIRIDEEISNEERIRIAEFFSRFSIYAFLQSGMDAKSSFSLIRISPQDRLHAIIDSAMEKYKNGVDPVEQAYFTAQFITNNTDRSKRSRFKNYKLSSENIINVKGYDPNRISVENDNSVKLDTTNLNDVEASSIAKDNPNLLFISDGTLNQDETVVRKNNLALSSNYVLSNTQNVVTIPTQIGVDLNNPSNQVNDVTSSQAEKEKVEVIEGTPDYSTSVSKEVDYQYFGKNYKVLVVNGVGIEVVDAGKSTDVVKLLKFFNENPDVDPQNGKQFRFIKTAEVKKPTKTVVVPEGSNPNNNVIFETPTEKYLMNDQQQTAYDEIFSFVRKKLDSPVKQEFKGSQTKSFEGSDAQFNGIIPMQLWNNMIGLIGRGGVGKTTLISEIVKQLEINDFQFDAEYDVMYLAPTHNAVLMLRESLGVKTGRKKVANIRTTQSFTKRNTNNPSKADPKDLERMKKIFAGKPVPADTLYMQNLEDLKNEYIKYFEKNGSFPRNSILKQKVVIIDESSMLSENFIEDLATLIEFEQELYKEEGISTPPLPVFIYMGDYRQLSPVDSNKTEGVISGTLFGSEGQNEGKAFELTQVMRTKDKAFHKIFDSVGNQVDEMRKAVEEGRKVPEFSFAEYDRLTNESSENMWVVPKNDINKLINFYIDELSKSNNPYEIFWTHYNNNVNENTIALFDKIRASYFKKLGYEPDLVKEKVTIKKYYMGKVTEQQASKIFSGDYIEFSGTEPISLPETIFNNTLYLNNIIYPRGRYKVLDIKESKVPLNEIGIGRFIEQMIGIDLSKIDVDVSYMELNNRYDEKIIHTIMRSDIGTMFKVKRDSREVNGKKKNFIYIEFTDPSSGNVNSFEIPWSVYFDNQDMFNSLERFRTESPESFYNLSYIGSTHTVQGNSLNKIIVGDENIRQNSKVIDPRDTASSLYVALTRVRSKLIILKPDTTNTNIVSEKNDQSLFNPEIKTTTPEVANDSPVVENVGSSDDVLNNLRNNSSKLDPAFERRRSALRNVIANIELLRQTDPAKFGPKIKQIAEDFKMIGESDGFIGSTVPETSNDYVSTTNIYEESWGEAANKNFKGMNSVMVSGSGTWNPSSRGGKITFENINDHFTKFYEPLIEQAIAEGVRVFNVGKAPGIDKITREFLLKKGFTETDNDRFLSFTVTSTKSSSDNINQPFVDVNGMTISPIIKERIDNAIETIKKEVSKGKRIVVPQQGLGQYLIGADPITGELNKNAKPVASQTFLYLSQRLAELGIQNNNFNQASGISTEEILKQQKVVTDEEVIEAMMCLFGIGK